MTSLMNRIAVNRWIPHFSNHHGGRPAFFSKPESEWCYHFRWTIDNAEEVRLTGCNKQEGIITRYITTVRFCFLNILPESYWPLIIASADLHSMLLFVLFFKPRIIDWIFNETSTSALFTGDGHNPLASP